MTRQTRSLLLLFVLIALGIYYVQESRVTSEVQSRPIVSAGPGPVVVDQPASLELDDAFKANILHYIDGVSVVPAEDNIAHAIQLDHAVGRPQISRGEYREAYRTYQQVLAISYRHANLMGIGIALTIMADVAHRAKNLDEALFTALLAYKVAEQMKSPEEMGVVELLFARMLHDRDPGVSVMWLLRAREHLQASRYREDYVRALPSLAGSLTHLGDHEGATKLYAEAWEESQRLGNEPTHQWTKSEAANGYATDLARADRHEQAIAVLQRAQTFFTPSEKPTDRYTGVLRRLAYSYAALKNTEEAGRYYHSAYANYELTRANEPGEDAKARLDTEHAEFINDFVRYSVRTGSLAASLALLESNKARTLQDIFEDPSYKQRQEEWTAMERRQAKEGIEFWERPGDDLLPMAGADRARDYTEMRRRHDHERRQLQVTLQLKELVAMGSLSAEHIGEIQRGIPTDTALISFLFSHEEVSAFVLSKAGIRHIPLLADGEECRRMIQQLRLTLTNPHNDLYCEPAQWLFAHLLQPIVKVIPNTIKTLVYSPDGLLSRIPLEALMDGGHFVAESYEIYRVPSLRYATALHTLKARPVQYGIACVDPDISGARLPFQQETGDLLRQLYGAHVTALVGKECSESRLVQAIQGTRHPSFLHIGAHGTFYPARAMESAIWLSSENGHHVRAQNWNANAIATVTMSGVELVTLSSCETGLTDPAVPRDVFGLERAFFFAGAKTVVAPLWAVNDRATAEFMSVFHKAYHRNIPAISALKHAQRTLLQTRAHRHPFYWAAFVFTGAAR